MDGAKIQLSPAEQKLVRNAEVLLTKNRVVEKMRLLLEGVQTEILRQAPTFSNAHIFETAPKISRGENYLGLPYLVLDYPRVFQQQHIFAIRSFFWWGHFFSSTLHLSGSFKSMAMPKLEAAASTFSKHHIGINHDPWQHHFEADNYQPIAKMQQAEFKALLHEQLHVKLAAKLPVEAWESAGAFLLDNWKLYLNAVL